MTNLPTLSRRVSEAKGPSITREAADIMALAFIQRNPGDCIGVIEREDQFAAAMVFSALKERGLLIAEIGPLGPCYFITKAGAALLAIHERKERPLR